MLPLLALLVVAAPGPAPAPAGRERAKIPAGVYRPFFADTARVSDAGAIEPPPPVEVAAFELDVRQVTQAEYLAFVKANPRWRRSRVPRLFAEAGYLKGWREELEPSAPRAPVTEVSWFAAKAYCKWRGGRLPTVAEWELAAQDASAGPRILEWYSRPSGGAPREAGSGAPNRLGVRDLHALVWEWVLDFNANLVADDGRDPSPGGGALFCGAGAAKATDPNDYATFMRYAFRDSLRAHYTLRDLGFRCARSR